MAQDLSFSESVRAEIARIADEGTEWMFGVLAFTAPNPPTPARLSFRLAIKQRAQRDQERLIGAASVLTNNPAGYTSALNAVLATYVTMAGRDPVTVTFAADIASLRDTQVPALIAAGIDDA